MGAQTRLDRKRAEKIASLERVAARLFAERGFEATGFEEIAAAMDLRGPSLYHYFSSKEELFLRCIRQSASEVLERLQKITAAGDEPVETLKHLIEDQVYIELRDYPEFVPLFFKIQVPVETLRGEILASRREHAAIFELVVREMLGRRSGPLGSARVQLEIAFGALAYLPEWFRPGGALTVEQIAAQFAETLSRPFVEMARADQQT